MISDYIISKASSNDALQLAHISRTTFFEAFADQNTEADMELHLNEYYSIEKMKAELQDPLVSFFLAYCNKELVGYLKMSRHQKPEEDASLNLPLELERIYSLNKMIGKGVGKLLMQTAIAYAQENGNKTIWLGVFQKNETAISFYKKWGFEIYGEHEFVVGKDIQTDWLMKKQL